MNAKLITLEKQVQTNFQTNRSEKSAVVTVNGYNLADLKNDLINQYITYAEVDTYAEAVQLNTSKFPLRIRVNADENAGNTPTTYDYWPNSGETDKLEQASF